MREKESDWVSEQMLEVKVINEFSQVNWMKRKTVSESAAGRLVEKQQKVNGKSHKKSKLQAKKKNIQNYERTAEWGSEREWGSLCVVEKRKLLDKFTDAAVALTWPLHIDIITID